MSDPDCVELLRWALPRLRLRWPGFRKVRRQLRHRLHRRMRELGIEGFAAYRAVLESDADEWLRLDQLCRIPISRFYRDRGVFEHLGGVVLPALAEAALATGCGPLWCWSAGCASGEEPYTLRLAWVCRTATRFPGVALRIVATDADSNLLERAARGGYAASSLKELPKDWIERAFTRDGALFSLRPDLRASIDFRLQDIRIERPSERFHLILCRNLAFTYFDLGLQRDVLAHLHERLLPGGILVIGSHESLPSNFRGFSSPEGRLGIYTREEQA